MPLPGARRRATRDRLPPEVLADVVDTLVACPAFTDVPRAELAALAARAEIAYLAAEAEPLSGALVVLRGGLALRDEQDRATDLVGEGEYAAPAPGERVAPVESCLVLWLPDDARSLAWSAPASRLPRRLLVRERPAADLRRVPVRRLMRSPVATASPEESCRDAAARMADSGISSVLVREGDRAGGRLGILTDRDLRGRLVAQGRDPATPVREVATWAVRTVEASTTAFEALLEMLATGIHHLPVVEHGRVVGMLSSGDLELLESRSPMRVRVAVDRADDLPAVASALEELPASVEALLAGGTPPREAARMVATITDRVHERLLRMAAAELGPAPTPLGWVAFGSQARREQTLHTDQDHGLLLPDGLAEAELAAAREHAARLAAWMVDALVECGYPRCPGGVMATEPDWCGTVPQWRSRVTRLLRRPSEQHLLQSTILFDLRTVSGELDAGSLLAPVIGEARGQASFLGHLARTAASHRPPLGFLGRFAVERGGENSGRFDVKAGAMLPITDLARLATLARGGIEVGTDERLVAAGETGAMSRDLAATLREGHQLATGIRLRLHLHQQREGLRRDNWADPADLDAHDRSVLRETFRAVRTAQEHLSARYLTGMLG